MRYQRQQQRNVGITLIKKDKKKTATTKREHITKRQGVEMKFQNLIDIRM